MDDWLAKLNYAAAFRTSGVRMRGVVGGSYDGQGRRALRRLDAEIEGIQTPTGEVTVARSKIDHNLAHDILSARREIMRQKIGDANEQLEESEKRLELQLRNSRHLQILAPIHPKTRESMLLSAGRLAAQLKWTRVEIWRLKCHRDILLMDLEEEQQLLGLTPEGKAQEASPTEKAAVTRDEAKASDTSTTQRSPRQSPRHLSISGSVNAAEESDDGSPMTDVFQTPPTSAAAMNFQESLDSRMSPERNADRTDPRKASVSSGMSSNPSVVATPPRKTTVSSGSASEKPPMDQSEEVDANERDLLEQAGLLDTDTPRPADSRSAISDAKDALDRKDRHSNPNHPDRLDRSKIRRSLQRTLKEGAGHLSHHRSRRGRESVSSGATDETVRDSADVLTRGSGSFVVHGKKASVISFGAELQSMSPDDRIRRNRSLQATQARDDAASTTSSGGPASEIGDYRSVLAGQGGPSGTGRDRRESANSASTTTARSFRDLHRKYSSAQAAKAAASAGGLTVPSDTDSEVAVSFSDGRRTPLPPIQGETDSVTGDDVEDDSDDGEESVQDDDEDGASSSAGLGREARETQFFTPEPPASPTPGTPSEREGVDERTQAKTGENLPSPPVQAVGA